MSDNDLRDSGSSYFALEGTPDAVLHFSRPDQSAIAAIREVAASQPVRPFVPDGSGIDRWERVSVIGDVDRVVDVLAAALKRDYEAKVAELGEFCDLEILIAESNVRPDAVHVVTKITPKDKSGGSITYGARLQRLDIARYALWSDY